MANIVYPNTFVASTVARASEVNDNFTAITDQVNGNLQATNLASNAVTTAKILDGQVTDAKIASGVDASKLTTGTLPSARIADDGVTTVKIADANVTEAKLNFAPLVYGDDPTITSPAATTVALGASPGDTALMPAGFLTISATWLLGTIGDIVFDLNSSAWMELPAVEATAGGTARKAVQVFSDGANIRARRVNASSATGVSVIKHAIAA